MTAERPDAGEGLTAELRALLAAATDLPWDFHPGFDRFGTDELVSIGHNFSVGHIFGHGSHDAALIVAAVNALPTLLDELDRLRRETAAAEAVVGRVEALADEWELDFGRGIVGSLADAAVSLRAALRAGEAGDE